MPRVRVVSTFPCDFLWVMQTPVRVITRKIWRTFPALWPGELDVNNSHYCALLIEMIHGIWGWSLPLFNLSLLTLKICVTFFFLCEWVFFPENITLTMTPQSSFLPYASSVCCGSYARNFKDYPGCGIVILCSKLLRKYGQLPKQWPKNNGGPYWNCFSLQSLIKGDRAKVPKCAVSNNFYHDLLNLGWPWKENFHQIQNKPH